MDKAKIIKMVLILAAITVLSSGLIRVMQHNSMSLAEYEAQNKELRQNSPAGSSQASTSDVSSDTGSSQTGSTSPESGSSTSDGASSEENFRDGSDAATALSSLIGATLNGNTQKEKRVTYSKGFYYEPLSEHLCRYIRGISFPATEETAPTDTATKDSSVTTPSDKADTAAKGSEDTAPSDHTDTATKDSSATTQSDKADTTAKGSEDGSPEDSRAAALNLTTDELRYVHIWYFDFDGNPVEGELICNEYIAQDLVEIFHSLYRNEYQLGSVRLIDEFDADANASMEANNSYCFNYFEIDGNSSALSEHTYGLAVDINPYYNPRITYSGDGSLDVLPSGAADYAERTRNFAYKIDENDLCYRLFTSHGFTWGGNWNHRKDYSHFYKVKP